MFTLAGFFVSSALAASVGFVCGYTLTVGKINALIARVTDLESELENQSARFRALKLHAENLWKVAR